MLRQAHSPLVRSPLVPDAEMLMHGVLHVTLVAETLTYGEREGDMKDTGGQGFPHASLPNPAWSRPRHPAALFLHVEQGEKSIFPPKLG